VLAYKYTLSGPKGSMLAVYYKRGGESYIYTYPPDRWFDAMECCIAHGLDDQLSITVDEAGWVCRIMEDKDGDSGPYSG